MKRNLLLLWLRDALNAGAAALSSVSMLSAFFLSAGLSEEEIGVYLALTPFVNFIVSLLFSGITARVRKTVRAYSLTGFLTAAATLLFLFFCRENVPHGVFYAGIMSAGCLLSVFTALKNIFDYKQPCEVMELSDYSVYVSFNGIVSGVAGILCGAALARLYAVRDFYPVTAAAFLCAGLFLAAASVLNGFLRVLHPAGSGNAADTASEDDHPAEKKNSGSIAVIRALFADRDFLYLLIPNFVRGFGAGAVSLVPVIAVSACAMDESGLAFITVCTYIGTLGSCLLYAWMSRRFGAARTGVLGGIGFCLIVPCFAGGKPLFFLLYTLSYVGYNIMCCAVPETVYLYVPEERVSAFHTWRLALTTLGTTLSTAVFGKLLDRVPPYVLTAVGAASVLVCVLGYRLCFRGRKKY